jgi:hypothetical protein
MAQPADDLPPAPENYTWTEEDRALLRTRNTMPQVPLGTSFAVIANMIMFSHMCDEILYAQTPSQEERKRTYERLPAYVKNTVMGRRLQQATALPCPWTQELKPQYQPSQQQLTVIISTNSTRARTGLPPHRTPMTMSAFRLPVN